MPYFSSCQVLPMPSLHLTLHTLCQTSSSCLSNTSLSERHHEALSFWTPLPKTKVASSLFIECGKLSWLIINDALGQGEMDQKLFLLHAWQRQLWHLSAHHDRWATGLPQCQGQNSLLFSHRGPPSPGNPPLPLFPWRRGQRLLHTTLFILSRIRD